MRIRLEPDGLNKYKVVLPGKNNNFPIGTVWKDPFKKGKWSLKAYFTTRFKDEHIIQQLFEDCMEAARTLANLYNKLSIITSREITEEFDFIWPDDAATD